MSRKFGSKLRLLTFIAVSQTYSCMLLSSRKVNISNCHLRHTHLRIQTNTVHTQIQCKHKQSQCTRTNERIAGKHTHRQTQCRHTDNVQTKKQCANRKKLSADTQTQRTLTIIVGTQKNSVRTQSNSVRIQKTQCTQTKSVHTNKVSAHKRTRCAQMNSVHTNKLSAHK